MMTASDYVDWQRYSGTCYTTESRVAMLRLAERELSTAGVVILAVTQFLEENRDGLDLPRWRRDVLAVPEVAVLHVQRTARALAAIGASRVAAVLPALEAPVPAWKSGHIPAQRPDIKAIQAMMREALSGAGASGQSQGTALAALASRLQQALHPVTTTAPPQLPPVESPAELQRLLEQFAAAHQSELAGDVERYGDPRRKPDFDPQQRLTQIEQEYRRRAQWMYQDQQANALYVEFRSLQNAAAEASAANSKKLLRLAAKQFKQYQAWVKRRGEFSERLTRWLADFEQLRNARPDLFRRSPTRNTALAGRLDAIGEYLLEEVSRKSGMGRTRAIYRLTWHSPRGLACDWASLRLQFDLPKNNAALTAILDAWDRFALRNEEYLGRIRGELLDHFQMHHGDDPGPFLRDLYCDEAGHVVVEKVLQQVADGRLEFEVSSADRTGAPPIVNASARFAVVWDDEHGFETGIDL